MRNEIDPKVVSLTSKLSVTIDQLAHLTEHVKNDALQETLEQLQMQLEAPFTFVIVGEVKAGKSSFINALLESEKEICKVAASPMTDTIQQIVYGEKEEIIQINPYIKKITEPIEILKEISIVDTPGTNTIVDHHQEITERFIPFSDLIVFVFEAKNPYRQSAWEFLDFINQEWHRKIIFVLQQMDLMEPDDLITNINGVTEHAIKKGIPSPIVFAVSAKMELKGEKSDSGYIPIREYIAKNITGGRAPYLKLQNSVSTASNISETIGSSLALRGQQYQLDLAFRQDIRDTLDNQELKTKNQVNLLVENLLATYDKITREKEAELHEGLSVFKVLKKSLGSIFSSEGSINDWLTNQSKDFELQLNTSLKEKLNAGIMDVADNIQMMGKIVDSKIKTSKTVLTDSDEIFADIAERRTNVLKDLHQSFSQFMNQSDNFYDSSLVKESSKMAPNLATGGGIAVVGVIITALVNGAVFDITGGILTTVGIFFASISLGLNRRKILSKFKEEIIKGHNRLNEEVTTTLNNYTTRIKDRINDNFITFDHHLTNEKETLGRLNSLHTEINQNLKDQQSEIKAFV